MPYWLTNPDHGVMPVYSESEVARHIPLGWSLLNQGESPVYPVMNGDTTRGPEDVIEEQSAEQVVREVLAESMRMDPPPTHKYAFEALPGEGPTTPLTASVRVFNVLDQATIKRKPGRPPKAK
jgi:hypothetical protein